MTETMCSEINHQKYYSGEFDIEWWDTITESTHNFKKEDTLLFGSESKRVHQKVHDKIIHKLNIPINIKTRSLNLSASVAIGASEALRQINTNN